MECLNGKRRNQFRGGIVKRGGYLGSDNVVEVLGVKTVESLIAVTGAHELRGNGSNHTAVRILQHTALDLSANNLRLHQHLLIMLERQLGGGGKIIPRRHLGHTDGGTTAGGFDKYGKTQQVFLLFGEFGAAS